MTTIDLDAIQARADAALVGPWYLVPDEEFGEVSIRQEESDGRRLRGSYVEIAQVAQWNDADECSPTAEFIAHAREDIPVLIARVRELESYAAEFESCAKAVENVFGTVTWPSKSMQAVIDRWKEASA